MTPTEQDKELLKLVEDIRGNDYGPMSRFGSNEEAADFIKQLITADRKRVALEARIDERNKIALDTYRGKTVSESTNWQAKFEYFIEGNERRIAELKA